MKEVNVIKKQLPSGEVEIDFGPMYFRPETLMMVEGDNVLKLTKSFSYNWVGSTLWALCPIKNIETFKMCFNDRTAKWSGYDRCDLV
jgi:hypothetical protein